MTVKAARAGARGATGDRHRARELAVQWLYQHEVSGVALEALADTFWDQAEEAGGPLPPAVRAYAERLAAGTAAHLAEIDPIIEGAGASWRIERMNVVDRLVLRLAVYELRHETDLPAGVVIDEALELARTFSSEESVRFVNGVLDAVRRQGEP